MTVDKELTCRETFWDAEAQGFFSYIVHPKETTD